MAIRKRLRGFARRFLGRDERVTPTPATAPRAPAEPGSAPLHLETDDDDDETINVEVDSALVADWIQEARALLFVDIREVHEMEAGHIRDAWLLPMGDVPDGKDDLPRGPELVVYCAAGARSYGVAHFLREQGFTAWSMVGGIGSWLAQGGDQVVPPTERDFHPAQRVRLTAAAAARVSAPAGPATIQEIRDVEGATVYTVAVAGVRLGALGAADLEAD